MIQAPRRANAPFGEHAAIRLLSSELGGRRVPGVRLGIGDDAAVLSAGGGLLVWTVDASVEGTHFERSLLSLADVGWKSFQAAASDLAAMGARPVAALSALELPPGFSRAELGELAKGQAAAATAARCPVVGGNIARATKLAVTTTLLGRTKRPLTRTGARAGEEVWLAGEVGLAAAGFALLSRSESGRRRTGMPRAAVQAWRRPVALLSQGVALVGRASAAMDVSDGLSGDVSQLSRASQLRLVLEETALRRVLPRALLAAARRLGRDPFELALVGGEDYALIATGPARKRPRFARRIGRCERGEGAFVEAPDGTLRQLGDGFDHLAG